MARDVTVNVNLCEYLLCVWGVELRCSPVKSGQLQAVVASYGTRGAINYTVPVQKRRPYRRAAVKKIDNPIKMISHPQMF